MALTYVYLVSPSNGAAATPSGTRYTPNAAGVITGVAAADAVSLQGVGTAQLQLLLATGATGDRPIYADDGIDRGAQQRQPSGYARRPVLRHDALENGVFRRHDALLDGLGRPDGSGGVSLWLW
jgi:hypothetical protein